MDNIEQWQSANIVRAALYRWFADVFTLELSDETINDLLCDSDGDSESDGEVDTKPNSHTTYLSLHHIFSSLGLEQQSRRVYEALKKLKQFSNNDRKIELAADFAQLFLLSGRDSAPPYASYYLDEDKMLFSEPAQQMRKFLSNQKLKLHPDFNEPNDHLSVYLQVMSLWASSIIKTETEIDTVIEKQLDFLDNALLSWLEDFVQRCQNIPATSDFYPALTQLLLDFVLTDRDALRE